MKIRMSPATQAKVAGLARVMTKPELVDELMTNYAGMTREIQQRQYQRMTKTELAYWLTQRPGFQPA